MLTISIYFAYLIVTPFRYYLEEKSSRDISSVNQITSGLLNSNSSLKKSSTNVNFKMFINRLNYSFELYKIILYKKKYYDPDFTYLIFTTPFQIFIPRFLWQNKPKANLGRDWLNPRVFHNYSMSSRAFGPLGFLYLAGGIFGIISGFIFVAFCTRFISTLVKSSLWGYKLIGFGLLNGLINMESQFNFYIINLVQLFLIFMFLQYIIFNKYDNS